MLTIEEGSQKVDYCEWRRVEEKNRRLGSPSPGGDLGLGRALAVRIIILSYLLNQPGGQEFL